METIVIKASNQDNMSAIAIDHLLKNLRGLAVYESYSNREGDLIYKVIPNYSASVVLDTLVGAGLIDYQWREK